MKKLLITGGTGSFGQAMLEEALSSDWDVIRIFSRDEKKQNDMRLKYKNQRIEFILGDVRQFDSINLAMHGITHVFHASALKQVPSCEFFPLEAIKTNTLGTYNAVIAAKKNTVKNFVLLSTDKAAYPINAMGQSKAMAEKIVLAEAFNGDDNELTLNITRYGNVMGSRGSVIPLFFDQLKKGKPLSITDFKMTRFMMSISQSVKLVEFALHNGKNGDLFVHKAKSASVFEIAKAVGDCIGVIPNYNEIGIRGGEKMYETLATSEEMSRSNDLGDYYVIPPDLNYLSYNKYFDEGNPGYKNLDEFNSDNASRLSVKEISSWFRKLGFDRGNFYD